MKVQQLVLLSVFVGFLFASAINFIKEGFIPIAFLASGVSLVLIVSLILWAVKWRHES
ncbi:hypothetical protein [Priestia endophytica]|uniref:hypothetical protein n=1 Tax=Priestia endophytica TaxID=135735 RepID=UPI00227F19CB|nr:hypothetical protein [Priestia endophytica]MCY8233121.1 hypothetical protein [Priestia endophytica]